MAMKWWQSSSESESREQDKTVNAKEEDRKRGGRKKERMNIKKLEISSEGDDHMSS